jgi:hypothetical protein
MPAAMSRFNVSTSPRAAASSMARLLSVFWLEAM